MDTTLDGLLNRRVTIEQPKHGYRVAVDTVLVAAAVPAQAGHKILDLGCGVGGIALCLAARVPGLSVTGIEIQPELVELVCRNTERNELQTDIKILQGDVTNYSFEPEFDHVVMNPPYHDEARHDVSAHDGKRTANTEKEGDLAVWIAQAAQALKPPGSLTLIHRADRLDEILKHMEGLFGGAEILPLLPRTGVAPKRVIIRARKNEKSPIKQCDGLLLHKPEGGYTDEAEAILRHGEALLFNPN